MDDKPNTVIESLGVYLPPKSYSTTEVLQGCKNQFRFPLEKVSGIKSRRMAGQEEFSLDLAKKAVADCLEKSMHAPEDIDLIICCNISRFDGPDRLSFEPSTSARLKKHFGFTNAIVFDITNACAGMFTGIYIVNTLIKTGAIRQGMVVSGEYITHLTQTAQNEIEGFMDNRLACLTLGDAGAAIILEKGANKQSGFQEIDLQTYGRYSPYCIGKQAQTGGWIMYTDSVNLTDVGIKSGAEQALNVLQRNGWEPDDFQHLILHQTSRMTLNSARREINKQLNSNVFHDGNTINNLEQRGNTASTSHFVAIADQIRNKNIQSKDRVVFCISASGLVVGTALYVFDDLPDRLGQSKTKQTKTRSTQIETSSVNLPRIQIESVAISPQLLDKDEDTLDMLHRTAENCLEKSSYQANDIGLLIHSGVYRSEYLLEPAYAALLAGKLEMNATISEQGSNKSLAFDIFNGSIGFLNACFVAQNMIAAGNCERAMVVASECENNAKLFPDQLLGIRETASAIILDTHPEETKGFSQFLFNYDLESQDSYQTHCSTSSPIPRLIIDKEPDLEEKYLDCIIPLVEQILQLEGMERNLIDRIFPPQISNRFIVRLSERLNLPLEKFVEVVGEGTDLFSSSLPYGVEYADSTQLIKSGEIALMIAVGSGIQVGCAIYHF
ncbi:MAG: 3-oxoacyl-[acyl-carrier-protein] synthase III C-terminal domain-containing protein [Bacteroidia bacterium]